MANNDDGIRQAAERVGASERSYRKRLEQDEKNRLAEIEKNRNDSSDETSMKIRDELITLNRGVSSSTKSELVYRKKQLRILEKSLSAIEDDKERAEMTALVAETKKGISQNNTFTKGLTEKLTKHIDSITGVIVGVVADSPLLAAVTAGGIGKLKEGLENRSAEKSQLADFAQGVREEIEKKLDRPEKSEKEDMETRRENLVAAAKQQDSSDALVDHVEESVMWLELIHDLMKKDGGGITGADLAMASAGGEALKGGARAAASSLPVKLFKGLLKGGVITALIGSLFGGIDDALKEYAKSGNMGNAISHFLGGVLEFISFGMLDAKTVGDKVAPLMNGLLDVLMTPFRTLSTLFKLLTGQIGFSEFEHKISDGAKTFIEGFGKIFDVIKNAAASFSDMMGLTDWLSSMNESITKITGFNIKEETVDAINKIPVIIKGMIDDVVGVFSKIVSEIDGWITSAFDSAKREFDDKVNSIKQMFFGFFDTIGSGAKTFLKMMGIEIPDIKSFKTDVMGDYKLMVPDKSATVEKLKQESAFNRLLMNKPSSEPASIQSMSNANMNVDNSKTFNSSGIYTRGPTPSKTQ